MTEATPHPLVVSKFGGSSVADPGCWEHIESLVRERIAAGERPIIVCSALRGVTDALERIVEAAEQHTDPTPHLVEIQRRHQILGAALGLNVRAVIGEALDRLTALALRPERKPAPQDGAGVDGGPARVTARWRAAILASGEPLSTHMGAAWLAAQGLSVSWADARELLESRATPSDHHDATAYLSACCDHERDSALAERLFADGVQVVVTQGFIARCPEGETVVLGRGGSDTAASYLAALLGADRLEIWTDVPGLFTADPRKARHTRLLPRVTYEEAAVLGALGAKVLHPRCLGPVAAAGIPLVIRWTQRPEASGTMIGVGADYRRAGAKAVASRRDLCLIEMRRDRAWQPVGFMADVSRCFHAAGLSMDLIASSASEIRATIDLAANPGAEMRLPALMRSLESICEPTLRREVACVSIGGCDVSVDLERVARVQALLAEHTLHLVAHAADDTHFSYVVNADCAADLVGSIHALIFDGRGEPEGFGETWEELHATGEEAATAATTASVGVSTKTAQPSRAASA